MGNKIKQIMSYGGGVNSMALLCLAKEGKVKIDEAIFCDPGAELPETYEYNKKYAEPLCKELGIKFHVIPGLRQGLNLLEYCYKYRIFPMRKYRSCTQHHKVFPLLEWEDKQFEKESYNVLIGIDYGEKKRVKRKKPKHHEDRVLKYPLIDLEIDRKGCKRIIAKHGYPVPVKSGCYICPFKGIKEFRWLLEVHPDLFKIAEELEEIANLRYEKNKRANIINEKVSLKDIRLKGDDCTIQGTLEGEMACVFCHL